MSPFVFHSVQTLVPTPLGAIFRNVSFLPTAPANSDVTCATSFCPYPPFLPPVLDHCPFPARYPFLRSIHLWPLLHCLHCEFRCFPYPSSNVSSPSVPAAMPISIGALVSIFFTLDVECVVTLTMMLLSSAMSSSSYGNVVQQTLGQQLLHCWNTSSSRTFLNLPSYLFVSLMTFLRMSPD